MILIKKKFESFAVGSTSNFFGQYIADEITNMISNNKTEIDITSTDYIGSIISGGFLNISGASGFSRSVLAIGLTYSIRFAISKLRNEEYKDAKTLLEDFIFDSILVYFIIRIIATIFSFLNVDENSSFSERVLRNLIDSIVINVVLDFKK